nr:MAG TPA: hypothetical protein [Caudoviricetes sp.]
MYQIRYVVQRLSNSSSNAEPSRVASSDAKQCGASGYLEVQDIV